MVVEQGGVLSKSDFPVRRGLDFEDQGHLSDSDYRLCLTPDEIEFMSIRKLV